MENNDDDDFTFCQVGTSVDKDGVEAQEVIKDIWEINIKDKSSDSSAINHSRTGHWKYKSPSNATPKKQTTIGFLSFNSVDASSHNRSSMSSQEAVPEGDTGNQSGSILLKDKLPSHATSLKKGTFGSLSFNVIDASPKRQLNENSQQEAAEGAGSSVRGPNQQVPVRKPVARAKVPFEKGYSQMDWLKLTRTHPDLAGLKGQSNKRLVSIDEVKQHQAGDSMWTVLKGRVYNLAPYMKFHPGGVDMLKKAVGKDSTSLFNKYHAWVNAEFLLEKCLVGILNDSQ